MPSFTNEDVSHWEPEDIRCVFSWKKVKESESKEEVDTLRAAAKLLVTKLEGLLPSENNCWWGDIALPWEGCFHIASPQRGILLHASPFINFDRHPPHLHRHYDRLIDRLRDRANAEKPWTGDPIRYFGYEWRFARNSFISSRCVSPPATVNVGLIRQYDDPFYGRRYKCHRCHAVEKNNRRWKRALSHWEAHGMPALEAQGFYSELSRGSTVPSEPSISEPSTSQSSTSESSTSEYSSSEYSTEHSGGF